MFASSAAHYAAPAVKRAQRHKAQTFTPLKHNHLSALLNAIENMCSLDFYILIDPVSVQIDGSSCMVLTLDHHFLSGVYWSVNVYTQRKQKDQHFCIKCSKN